MCYAIVFLIAFFQISFLKKNGSKYYGNIMELIWFLLYLKKEHLGYVRNPQLIVTYLSVTMSYVVTT